MNENTDLITTFYSAFQRKDYRTMQSLYHDDATFSDPVFQNLNSREVRAMWQMLLTSSSDLRIEFTDIVQNADAGSCHWQAWYTFSRTKRPVHNRITADFLFSDGKIVKHRDSFNLWRWSRQAFGGAGIILGWTPLFENKIRKTARARLTQFMSS